MKTKSELFKELKGLIRMNADTICDMNEGKISFGKMCEIIAKDIEKHLEEEYYYTKKPWNEKDEK
ncbi:MAG: hypothetical protein ACKOW2_04510 [Sphingobacteriaceae bacterium]